MLEKMDFLSRREVALRTLRYVEVGGLPAFFGGQGSDEGLIVA